MSIYPIHHNEEENRFEIAVDHAIAYVDYEIENGSIDFLHTMVPAEMEGQGIGSALARYALDYARKHNLQIIAECPFITEYIEKNPEY